MSLSRRRPVEAAGRALTHVEQQDESGGIKREAAREADQLKVKLKRDGGRRRRRR